MLKTCIIIGGSHTASQLASSLIQEGWEGNITIVSNESHPPYHRPPLSKDFLLGKKSPKDILIRPDEFYKKNNIEVRLNSTVKAIDRKNKTVTLENEEKLSYNKLAICTGSRARKFNIPGSKLKGVAYLRSIDDVNVIKNSIDQYHKAIIVGGGYIGLETAAMLKSIGLDVTVLEMAPRILARVAAPALSEFYTRIHEEQGVSIKTGVTVSALTGIDRVNKVICEDGRVYDADLVIIGIGVTPNIELANEVGLEIMNGIVVNQHCQTIDPDVFSAGDCANYFNPFYQQYTRLESVANANEQAKTAASSICNNRNIHNTAPWFWSDQYDLKLQMVGLNQNHDEMVLRGNPNTNRSFSAFYLKEGKVIAADCVNRPQEFMLAKQIINKNLSIPPKLLADETITPKQLMDFAE
ncbi:FAD-dependent oxidoreductase [Dasania sp. GY-MA-18]|uniref:FAD-dependent oxidoreductase n=1 Tax=Dasania phycosphaerae TaxID=2950436 RepID=A0A9J6RN10_9GAMM|nr:MULTISPECIES: FAD-dependent oxidoreductase [Dasania]MCR8923144.1 FAD-dependent oxidoreductase [Dasania sp. GY-MA-18]MCZ0865576.1 FAD-dependent oxidoreductase [Dasania phycosphaerae]MCZ0869301.1 FAD-dependent oxidoreductase [Dasania phycosphaerae]